MTLMPVDNDPLTAMRTSTWDRRSRGNSIGSTNVRQLQTLIRIAVASLGANSGTLEGKLRVRILSGFLFEEPVEGTKPGRFHHKMARRRGLQIAITPEHAGGF